MARTAHRRLLTPVLPSFLSASPLPLRSTVGLALLSILPAGSRLCLRSARAARGDGAVPVWLRSALVSAGRLVQGDAQRSEHRPRRGCRVWRLCRWLPFWRGSQRSCDRRRAGAVSPTPRPRLGVRGSSRALLCGPAVAAGLARIAAQLRPQADRAGIADAGAKAPGARIVTGSALRSCGFCWSCIGVGLRLDPLPRKMQCASFGVLAEIADFRGNA